MQVSPTNLLIIAAALLVVLIITILILNMARKRRDIRLRRHGAPVLVMPIDDPVMPPRPQQSREIFAAHASPTSVRQVTPVAPPIAADDDDADIIVLQHEPVVTRVPSPGDRPHAGMHTSNGVTKAQGEDGTLEFLPGRLEVVSGDDAGQEIHFVKPEGDSRAVISFGRNEGPPLRHVQLHDLTVSRQHARMVYASARWHLFNLSDTNPVTVNGTPLPTKSGAVALQEGDRIEMGAVTFVFRER